jgi:hypothetical protein
MYTVLANPKHAVIHGVCVHISPQPLHLSPTFKHLLKEQKTRYPMHGSGHGMVEWVQRYASAKLSVWLAGIWLAGGWVFHGGNHI